MIAQAADRYVANEAQSEADEKISEKEGRPYGNTQPETLFSVIRRSKIPEEEKTASRMSQEGVEMFMASFTPGRTMMQGMYYLQANPDVLKKLQKELDQINPDPAVNLSFRTLPTLPYLVSLTCPQNHVVKAVCFDTALL
jgi:cytochrome P450